MKKLVWIMFLVAGLSTQAQEQKGIKKDQREQLTPQQKNELRLKKLTIDLSLNATQQREIGQLLSDQSERREKMKAERKASKDKGIKLTADERFAMKSKMLDDEKALKDKMQKILDADQFKKWEEMRSNNRENMKERMHKRGDKKMDKE